MHLDDVISRVRNLKNVRKERFVDVGVVVLAMLIAYNGIYLTTLARKDALRRKLSIDIRKVVLLKEINILKQRIQSIEGLLGAEKSENDLIKVVSDLAAKNYIKILSTDPLPVKAYERYGMVSLNLKIVRTYGQIGKFIKDIETSAFLLHIDKLHIKTHYLDALPVIAGQFSENQLTDNTLLPETVKPEVGIIISAPFVKT